MLKFQNVRPNKLLPMVLLLVTLLGGWLWSCRSGKGEGPKPSCKLEMTYDAETTTIIRPADASQATFLSDLDKALMLPKREREQVNVCLRSDGTYTIEQTYATPGNPIEFPANTAGVWLKPRYKKVIDYNGQVSYFNDQNEIIRQDVSSDQSANVLQVLQLFNDIKSAPALTDADFATGLNTLSTNGMPMTHHSAQLASAKQVHADGSYSVIAIDKVAHMQVGQMNFNAQDELESLYMVKVSGKAPNVTLERMVQVFFFNAVDSNVKMKHESVTVFNNFSIVNQ